MPDCWLRYAILFPVCVEYSDARACVLVRPDPAGACVHSGRHRPGDQNFQPHFLHQIHKPSGKRIRYQKVVPGLGPVETDEIVKGYEVDKGKYVLVSEEGIDEVKLEAKRSIDLVQFVDVAEIEPIYFERAFYILPNEEDEDAEEAYVVLRDALRKTKKLGSARSWCAGRARSRRSAPSTRA